MWISFNEPGLTAWTCYGNGGMAPGRSDNPGTFPYIVTRNIILAHAEGYHVLKDKYSSQKGTFFVTVLWYIFKQLKLIWIIYYQVLFLN